MAKNTSTQIREFVKNALKSYYDNYQVKLSDNAKKDDVNPTIKLNNDGSVYIYGLGNYDGTSIRNASSLQEIITELGESHGDIIINAGNNIQVDTVDTTSTIAALGYTYNQEKNSFAELNSNIATGTNSHAEGYHTTATNEAEHAEGKYNQSHENQTIHSIGIGTTNTNRRNAFEVMQDGSIYVYGLGNYDGSTLTNVSTLQQVIENTGGGGQTYYTGDNIEITPDNSINALGYVYNKDTSSFAEGYSNSVTGTYAHAEGYGTSATGTYSHAEGSLTKTSNDAEHAEGIFNQSHHGTIHSIGIGTTSEYRKNAFEVMRNGSIYVYGLGNYDGSTLTNTSTLQEVINAGSGQTYYAGQNIEITQDNSINALGYVFNENIINEFNISTGRRGTMLKIDKSVILYAPGTSYGLAINSSNNITLKPENKIYLNAETECDNNITAVAFYQSSDERLKNIKSELSVENCYKLINDCSTIIYSLKTDEKDQNQIGMIAQQVKEIMPEVVQESNGYYSINYSRLSVVALNLIKDLSERIIELEKDHNKLEELIKRVEKLEK